MSSNNKKKTSLWTIEKPTTRAELLFIKNIFIRIYRFFFISFVVSMFSKIGRFFHYHFNHFGTMNIPRALAKGEKTYKIGKTLCIFDVKLKWNGENRTLNILLSRQTRQTKLIFLLKFLLLRLMLLSLLLPSHLLLCVRKKTLCAPIHHQTDISFANENQKRTQTHYKTRTNTGFNVWVFCTAYQQKKWIWNIQFTEWTIACTMKQVKWK